MPNAKTFIDYMTLIEWGTKFRQVHIFNRAQVQWLTFEIALKFQLRYETDISLE